MSQHQLGFQMFPMGLARVLERGLCSDWMKAEQVVFRLLVIDLVETCMEREPVETGHALQPLLNTTHLYNRSPTPENCPSQRILAAGPS